MNKDEAIAAVQAVIDHAYKAYLVERQTAEVPNHKYVLRLVQYHGAKMIEELKRTPEEKWDATGNQG